MGLDNLKGRQAAASKIVDKSTRKAHSSGTQQTCCVLELLPSSCPELQLVTSSRVLIQAAPGNDAKTCFYSRYNMWNLQAACSAPISVLAPAAKQKQCRQLQGRQYCTLQVFGS